MCLTQLDLVMREICYFCVCFYGKMIHWRKMEAAHYFNNTLSSHLPNRLLGGLQTDSVTIACIIGLARSEGPLELRSRIPTGHTSQGQMISMLIQACLRPLQNIQINLGTLSHLIKMKWFTTFIHVHRMGSHLQCECY